MFGVSHIARGVSLASIRSVQGTADGDIVDVILNPNPAVPLCWSALSIERATRATSTFCVGEIWRC
jgi:hypothetical protein